MAFRRHSLALVMKLGSESSPLSVSDFEFSAGATRDMFLYGYILNIVMRLLNNIQYLKDRVQSLFRSSMTTSSPPLKSPPWTRHEANTVTHACLSSRVPAIPNEIILQILDHPDFWIRTRNINARVASDNEPIRVGSTLQNRGEQQVLATNPLSQSEVNNIRRITYRFRSKDQGWSSHPQHRGTYEGSWTWFEGGVTCSDPISSNEDNHNEETNMEITKASTRYELQRNRHAGSDAEVYKHELDVHHGLLQHLAAGDSVVLWARASFPGWENRVFSASIEVWCADNLETP